MMRTAMLTAMLLLSPLALAQDDAPAGEEAPGTEEATEEPPAEEDAALELREVDLAEAMRVCMVPKLMDECEIDGMIGLCQLEPCDRGWKDGAPRVCKQCVPYAYAPEPVEPDAPLEVLVDADPDGSVEQPKGNGNGKRRIKKRDCGCDSSAAPISGLALAFILPIIARRRQ